MAEMPSRTIVAIAAQLHHPVSRQRPAVIDLGVKDARQIRSQTHRVGGDIGDEITMVSTGPVLRLTWGFGQTSSDRVQVGVVEHGAVIEQMIA